MKKIFLSLCLFLLLSQNSYANNKNCEGTTDSYNKFQCRVEQVCDAKYKNNKVSFDTESYKEASMYKEITVSDVFLVSNRSEKPLRKAVSVYKTNMNNIYNCAMIRSQINSLNLTKEKLLKIDKSGRIKNSIEPKIKQNLQKLELQAKQLKCKSIDKNIITKQNVLSETTYETCRFHYYMDYMKDYYWDIKNTLSIDENIAENTSFPISEVNTIQSTMQSAIDMEIRQAYDTFPIAFQAFSEYENNFITHFMLQIILDDFIVYREQLHKALNPFNQLVYKLSNVMKQ